MTAYYNEYDKIPYQAYLITNTVSGKMYVGITAHGHLSRWKSHIKEASWKRGGWALHAAIRKYGATAFIIEWVASSWTWEGICDAEKVLIRQWGTIAPAGYNLTKGGDGVRGLPTFIRQKISASNRGRKHTDEARAKIGEASKGHVVTPETRDRIRAKHIGKVLTEDHKAKLSAAKTGKTLPPRSDEHSRRISEGLRRAHARKKAAHE